MTNKLVMRELFEPIFVLMENLHIDLVWIREILTDFFDWVWGCVYGCTYSVLV